MRNDTHVTGPRRPAGYQRWRGLLFAVAAARLLYGLPYFSAVMSMRREGSCIEYASRRRGARGARLEVTWSVGDPIGHAAAGTSAP